jgi:hypothetical protein
MALLAAMAVEETNLPPQKLLRTVKVSKTSTTTRTKKLDRFIYLSVKRPSFLDKFAGKMLD